MAAPAQAPRELILAETAEQLPPEIPWLAFGEAAATPAAPLSLTPVFRANRARLRDVFVGWLGALNRQHASAAWWAHGTSAKNLLASRFGNQVLELLGLRLLLAANAAPRIGIVGASAAQADVLRRMPSVRVSGQPAARSRRPRLFYQLLRVAAAWLLRLRRMRSAATGGLHVLTYADGSFAADRDAFFGDLAGLLARRSPPVRCQFHAFLHGSLAVVARRLEAHGGCAPLYAELECADLINAYRDSRAALARVARWPAGSDVDGLDLAPLLREALREDIELGGYFHNLLVRAAARRLVARLKPDLLLYPFENKSLEKLLLLGVREAGPGCRTTGYQHTSVTPRHVTLLFAEGEAARTPLPDRVVTAGAVTREYLERNGRYPPGLLVEGCALRQPARAPLQRRAQDGRVNVLLALSSSARELAEALRLLLAAGTARPAWRLAVRPHPEFPLARLPEALRAEAAPRTEDLAGTPLEENLRWADVVVYASSTVGLEAMMAGRPVVNLDLGEALDTDPVLEPVPLRWRAESAGELATAVDEIVTLADAELSRRAAAAAEFLQRYFRPVTEERLEVLVRMRAA